MSRREERKQAVGGEEASGREWYLIAFERWGNFSFLVNMTRVAACVSYLRCSSRETGKAQADARIQKIKHLTQLIIHESGSAGSLSREQSCTLPQFTNS